MQAIKNKLNDMAESRKVKAEVKEEEKAEKELAKARMDVAHEVRLAKEAEAEMDLHVHKAAEKAARFEEKYPARSTDIGGDAAAAAANNISQRHNSSGKLDFS